jgi:2-dehydropantoate 2-reductase
MPRYLVFGAGAIGSIMGAWLHETGQEVVLIARPDHALAIQERGLRIEQSTGSHVYRLPAVSRLKEIEPRSDDRILITLKAQQTEKVLSALADHFPTETCLVSFQNAVRNEGLLASRFSRVYGGLVDFSGTFLIPGVVCHTRNRILAIGLFPIGMDETGEAIAADLEKAGFQVDCSHRIMEMKWWKLVINTTNALLAILDCWVQKGHSHPDYYPLVAEVMEESFNVLKAAGISTLPPSGVPPLNELIAKMRKGERAVVWDLPFEQRTYPSTWQDLKLARGSSEVSLFNGEITHLARQAGVDAPLNTLLQKIFVGMECHKEVPGKYTPAEMAKFFDQARNTTQRERGDPRKRKETPG